MSIYSKTSIFMPSSHAYVAYAPVRRKTAQNYYFFFNYARKINRKSKLIPICQI